MCQARAWPRGRNTRGSCLFGAVSRGLSAGVRRERPRACHRAAFCGPAVAQAHDGATCYIVVCERQCALLPHFQGVMANER
eukprot:10900235-Alexandrium_andersonii.AAC.1